MSNPTLLSQYKYLSVDVRTTLRFPKVELYLLDISAQQGQSCGVVSHEKTGQEQKQ